MTNKAKRISLISLVAVLFLAAIAMFSTVRFTTANAANGITMIIDAEGTSVARANGSAGAGWMQFPVRFEGSASGLSLSGGRDKADVYPFVGGGATNSLGNEDANYASKIFIGAEQADGSIEEKCIMDYIGHGIDWIGRFDGGKIVFCLTGSSAYPTNIRYVTFKAGFTWYTGAAASPVKIADTALEEEISFWTDGYGSFNNNTGTEKWQSRAKKIELIGAPTSVAQGDPIDFSGMSVKATYYNGTERTLNADEYVIGSYDSTNVGTTSYTVSYHGHVETVDVTVGEATRTLTSITLNKETISANRYELPDITGFNATLHFDNDTTWEIPVTQDMITGYDVWGAVKSELSTIATQTATVSYTHAGTTKNTTVTLNVTAPDTTKGLMPQYEQGNSNIYYADIDSTAKCALGVYVAGTGVSINASKKFDYMDKLEGAHVADYIELTVGKDTKTAAEWIKAGKLASIGHSGSSRFSFISNGTWVRDIAKVTFLAGLQWVQSDETNWAQGADKKTTQEASVEAVKNYYTVENAVVKEDISLIRLSLGRGTKSAQWVRYADSITATVAEDYVIRQGETIDRRYVTVTGHSGDKSWTIKPDLVNPSETDVTKQYYHYNLACDTSNGGASNIVVTYPGGYAYANFVPTTCEIPVNIVGEVSTLTGIRISKNPTTTTYNLGDFDWTWDGIEITATYHIVNNETGAEEDKDEVLNATEMKLVTYSDFNVFVAGTQTITVTYNDKTTTFNATVNYNGNYGMTVNFDSENNGYAADNQSRNLRIGVVMSGTAPDGNNLSNDPQKSCMVAGGTNALGSFPIEVDDKGTTMTIHNYITTNIVQKDFVDYILINGKTAGHWIAAGQLDWIGWQGWTLVLTFKPNASGLVFGENDPNYDPTANQEMITAIVLKAGLQFYSTTVDNWPCSGKENADKITRKKYACLTQDTVITNYSTAIGKGMKLDPETNTFASDAVEVVSEADKNVYKVGETFDVTGLKLRINYNDGTSEEIECSEEMLWLHVDEYEFETAGTYYIQICWHDEYMFAASVYNYAVTVIEPVYHTVTFDLNYDDAPEATTAQVEEDTNATKPADPTRTGYTFDGWYTDAACETAWNFGSDTVSADVTLYAKWTENAEVKPGPGENEKPGQTTETPKKKGCKSAVAADFAVVGGMLVLAAAAALIAKRTRKQEDK